jgi:hypothetical protein
MKNLLLFASGLLTGCLLLSSPIIEAASPRIVGTSGYLSQYDVVDEDENEICSEPWVDTRLKQIQCN